MKDYTKSILFCCGCLALLLLGCKKDGNAVANNPVMDERQQAIKDYEDLYLKSDVANVGWTGDAATCSAGTLATGVNEQVVARINFYRKIVGLPYNCTNDNNLSVFAQRAAALMHSNSTLNHQPPNTWACYSDTGKRGANNANLAMGVTASDAVDAFMIDYGSSNSAVGHRRWLLYPRARTFGHGATSAYSAIYCIDNNTSNPKAAFEPEFVAYPPKGYIVQDLFRNSMRWSFSIADADFATSTVSVTDETGNKITTGKEPIRDGYGENTLVFVPNITSLPLKDAKYTVTVSNVKIGGSLKNYTYNVTWVKR
jgi:uncharacterized protein YkwD